MSEDIHEIQARHSEENGKKDYGLKVTDVPVSFVSP